MISFMASGSLASISATIGVSMVPGHTALITDAARGIFERRAFGKTDHSMLGRMIHGPAGQTDQAADRGAVDDRAAPLVSHLAEFIFHAVPDAAQIDRLYAVIFGAAGISHLDG